MEKNFYTTDEAGLLMDVSPQGVRNWIRQGKIKAEKLGKVYIIEKAELERFKKEKMGA